MNIKKTAQKFLLGTALSIAPFLSGCTPGLGLEDQYVSENTSDVRGTWYKHGNAGGWYGPNEEWNFGWYYLKQYGNDVEGKYEHELYTTKAYYNDLETVTGTITGDKLVLMKFDTNNIPFVDLEETTVVGNTCGKLERTNTGIVRRATPW